MENKKRSRQEAESQKEIKSLKNDVARLTDLLEHELKGKSMEASVTQPAVATLPITTTHFKPEKKLMKNKKQSRQEAESQNEIKSLKNDVAKLINLLEHELKEKSIEASVTQPAIATLPITTTLSINIIWAPVGHLV